MKIIKVLILILFISGVSFSQKITEKQISGIPGSVASNAYDLKYDKKTGSYVYPLYDTTDDGVYVITSKGSSQKYYSANIYSSVFDSDGNVFTLASNKINDTVYTYFVLKNGAPAGNFESVNDNWSINGNYLYFTSKEGDKSYFNSLELTSTTITKSKPYDDIVLTYMPDRFRNSHGEPITYPGFTSDGKPYYIAYKDSTDSFMVIDGVEQKHYTNIDQTYCTADSSGNVVYVASSGQIFDLNSDIFLVKGNTEYKHFNYIYGPFIFDRSGEPIYNAGNADNKGHYPQVLMKGNAEISKWYNGGIGDYMFLPSGSLAYIGNKYINDKVIESYVVINGKEGKKHESAYNLQFNSDGEPMIIEQNGTLQHIVINDKKASDDFDNILYYKYSGNKLFYVAENYSQNTKKGIDETFVFIGNKKLGPFDVTPSEDSEVSGFLTVDDAGNYLLVGTKLVNKKDFDYESYVYTNSGKSGSYNGVSDFYLYKGRPIFVSYMYPDKKTPGSTSRVNIDGKDVGSKYEIITDFSLDAKTGKISFVGSKNGNVYYVEIAL